MQPIEFNGKKHPAGIGPYLLGVVALLGFVAGLLISFPAYAVGWAVCWGVAAYFTHRSHKKDFQFFKIKLDELGIEIQNKRGSRAMKWSEIESIAWRQDSDRDDDLVFKYGTQEYVYDRFLNEVDFSDFIQALKLKVPDKTRGLGRDHYNTEVHGLVAAARKMRSLKQPDKAEQCYREAIEAGEKAASTLGLGMIPVLEEYAALLEGQGKEAEAQTLTVKIALLRGRVAW